MCAAGPTFAFGVSAGTFETLGSQLPTYDPRFAALRSQCLDYFHSITHKVGGSKRCIFNFDEGLTPSVGDIAFTSQMCIKLALSIPDSDQTALLLSGQDGSLLELLPELGCFRDIMFYFKHSVSGTSPCKEAKPWLPAHATLHWGTASSSDDKKKDAPLNMQALAFSSTPQLFIQPETSSNPFSSFVKLFTKGKVERNKLSSADPTNVVASCSTNPKRSKKPIEINTEDDVLHLPPADLPSFGNVLTPSDSEKFLQFLTAPYIRIPLILDFFANGDPGRITALKCASLQAIVDAALFEPGKFRPEQNLTKITTIPVAHPTDREQSLATPCGKLFNEIAKSPEVITSSILRILERSLDMDVGKYDAKRASGPMILYAIRLTVRLEGYMKYAIKNHESNNSLSANSTHNDKLRGLETADMIKLKRHVVKIQSILHNRAFHLLESWLNRSGHSDGDDACLIHTHLLYMFKNVTLEELNFKIASVIMSSQVFLNINHRFTTISYDDLYSIAHSDEDDKENERKPSDPPPSIQLPQNEVFDLIQTQRPILLQFLAKEKTEANEIFEATVRIATNTGTRTASHSTEKAQTRNWQIIPHESNFGRFVPDTEDENLRDGSYRNHAPGQSYKDWMLQVTTKSVGTEINLQLSEFTLQNHKMMLLDHNILKNKDFLDAFLTDANRDHKITDIACAEVLHTTNRFWWRLVGRRFDVQSWAPDQRPYQSLKGVISRDFTRSFSTSLKSGERWINDILNDKIGKLLPNVNLYMKSADMSNLPFVEMCGFFKNPDDTVVAHTIKEVVVFRYPPTIQICDVHEYGRRFFRTLTYSSNSSLCLHDVDSDPYPDRVNNTITLSAGSPWTVT